MSRTVRWLAAWLLAAALSASSLGQETAIDFVEPVVRRTHLQALIDVLDLDRDQRSIVELLYRDYTDSLEAVIAAADARAIAAGRATVDDALSGRVIVPRDELRRTQVAVLEAYRDAWPEADRLLDDLMLNIEIQMMDEQERIVVAATRALLRRIVLDPQQNAGMTYEYAGDGVDLLQLVDAALDDGTLPLSRRSIASLLERYEADLDEYLQTARKRVREVRLERRLAGLRRDTTAIRNNDREAIEWWSRLHHLNTHTTGAIADVVRQTQSDAAAEAWIDAVDAASFPWLFEVTSPDRQAAWIAEQPFAADVLVAAAEHYDAYVLERRTLRRHAIGLMVRGRLDRGVIVHAMMDPGLLDEPTARALYEQLVQNTGELSELDRETTELLESLLDDEQRRLMRRRTRR